MWKRSLDIGLAGVGLVLAFPLMLGIWLSVRLCSPGPGLYRQQRMGRNGIPFTIYKFRSLQYGCDSTGLAYRGLGSDALPIVGPGKFLRQTHLDELPQLWNILRGDMSIVGPRPLTLPLHELLMSEDPRFSRRTAARPGLTGLGQVRCRNKYQSSNARDILRYDLVYLRKSSLALDIYLIFSTIAEVFGRRGI